MHIVEYNERLQRSKFDFFTEQFRAINFYTIKSAFGETKDIRSPVDLYQLPSDPVPEPVDEDALIKELQDVQKIMDDPSTKWVNV